MPYQIYLRQMRSGQIGREREGIFPLTGEQARLLLPKGRPAYICRDCVSQMVASFRRASDQFIEYFQEMAERIYVWWEGIEKSVILDELDEDVKDKSPPLCDCGGPLRIYHADEGTSGYYCPRCHGREEESNAD